MAIIRAVATVASFTVLSRILGFVRDVLIASALGAGPIADAFLVAFRIPNFFRRLFAEGAMNTSFIPIFSKTMEKEGRESAKLSAEHVLSVLLFFMIALVVIVELFIPWLIFLIAPGFSDTPDRLESVIEFTRITFPYIAFISMAALYSGILNSINRFSAAAAAPIILNVTMILAVAIFIHSPGYALSWAVSLAGLFQFLWLCYVCKKHGFGLKLRWPRLSDSVRQMLRLMLPSAVSAGVIQINMLIGTAFLSFLPTGAISYFFYADRLNQLPLSLVGVAASTALLPSLSKQMQMHDLKQALNTQNRVLELSFLLIIPATIALFILAEPMIQTLFQRKAFGYGQVVETSKVLTVFSIGLPAYVAVKIFSTTFFASYDTKTPLYGAILAVIVNVALNFVLIGPLSYVGIALATSIASWTNAGYLLYHLNKRNLFSADVRLLKNLPLFTLSSGIMAASLFVCLKIFSGYFSGGELERTIALFATIGIGLLVYFLSSKIMGAVNMRELRKI